MPVPWCSQLDGEKWHWGEYTVAIQDEPLTRLEALGVLAGQKDCNLPYDKCSYAATVAYKTSASKPILIIGLEVPRTERQTSDPRYLFLRQPVGTLKVYKNGTETPAGEFYEAMNIENARTAFFGLIEKELSPGGEPVKVGVLSRNSKSILESMSRRQSGCFGLIVITAFALSILGYTIYNIS